MSDLVVLGFDDLHGAAGARDVVRTLEKDWELELIDAVVVERPSSGKPHIHQSHHPVWEGLAGGGAAGFMLGTLFLQPLLAAAFGAASGGLPIIVSVAHARPRQQVRQTLAALELRERVDFVCAA